MGDEGHFWRLEHFSDRQLLERLQGVLRRQRCRLAELLAHLGEVEERRLHLAAAHGSMFSYCVRHLGMSEDEACRRIELARLARRFPLLFGELASGRLSLSVALLLKPVLTADNHIELIAAARGASLRASRELLAARFPSPDVPSRIRKLPERLVPHAAPAIVAHAAPAIVAGVTNAVSEAVANAMPEPMADRVAVCVATPRCVVATTTAPGGISSPLQRRPELEHGSLPEDHAQGLLQNPPTGAEPSHSLAQACVPRHSIPHQPRRARERIDPLSAGRYRIVFTADASLKHKLELARDLLRHSNPSGDLAPVVSRALDLLLQELLQRRFGARRKDTPQPSVRPASHTTTAPPAAPIETPQVSTPSVAMLASSGAAPSSTAPRTATPQPSTLGLAAPPPTWPVAATTVAAPSIASTPATILSAATLSASTPPAATSHIPRAARRAVLERDGLGCCWVDAAGQRCGSTAWLELDHRHPAGKGGNSGPENVRLLCRAHNRFAAERAYGREHVERAIQARQRSKKRRGEGRPPPSPAPA